jgi:hypothetical protein
MSEVVDVRPNIPAPIADDDILSIARMAEQRIEAIKKIKQVALSVTNASDWTDQQDRPYLQASGSEKVANLFDISWGFATPEPVYEEDRDGHYTFTFRGWFRMGTRTIELEGSRSSRDPFFVQYKYEGNARIEIPVEDRNNKRDVRMAALTNFLGNGITRILGIRNLSWDDLQAFAGIKKDDVKAIQYKKKGEKTGNGNGGGGGGIQEPGTKINDPDAPITDGQKKAIFAMLGKLNIKDDIRHSYLGDIVGHEVKSQDELTKGEASTIIKELQKRIDGTTANA